MFLSIVFGLGLFASRRGVAPTDELDVALAGAQIGLERKRQRWLLFLIGKEEECLSRIAQTAEIDQQEHPGEHPRDTLTLDPTGTARPHDS